MEVDEETPQLDQPPPADFGPNNSYLDMTIDGHAPPLATNGSTAGAPPQPGTAQLEQETPYYGPIAKRRWRVNWPTKTAEPRPAPYPQLALEGPPPAMEPPEEIPPLERPAGQAFEEAETPQLQGPERGEGFGMIW